MKLAVVKVTTLGSLDGPPIHECQESRNLKNSAVYGSQALLQAIERAGLRP